MKQTQILITTACDSHSMLTIREMEDLDLPGIMQLVQDEGWVLSSELFMAVWRMFPKGVLVAVDDHGTVQAFISTVMMGGKALAVWNIIVGKAYRQKGLGRELMREIEKVSSGKVISLLSLQGSEGFYKKLGYQFLDNPTILVSFIRVDVEKLQKSHFEGSSQDLILSHTSVPFEDLEAYDSQVVGYSRAKYLETILFPESIIVMVSKDPYTGKINGYGGIDSVNKSLVIEPLYADSDEVAFSLFQELVLSCVSVVNFDTVRLLHPQTNCFMRTLGVLTFERVLRHMTSRPLVMKSLDRIYSLCSTAFY